MSARILATVAMTVFGIYFGVELLSTSMHSIRSLVAGDRPPFDQSFWIPRDLVTTATLATPLVAASGALWFVVRREMLARVLLPFPEGAPTALTDPTLRAAGFVCTGVFTGLNALLVLADKLSTWHGWATWDLVMPAGYGLWEDNTRIYIEATVGGILVLIGRRTARRCA